MYAKGISVRDIQDHMKEIYGLDFSPEAISRITNKVLDKAREWQNRSLDAIYSIVFLDALFYKARIDSEVKKHCSLCSNRYQHGWH